MESCVNLECMDCHLDYNFNCYKHHVGIYDHKKFLKCDGYKSGIEIVFVNDKPYGIRNKRGFLLFFPDVQRFPDQDERYNRELKEQLELADNLLKSINKLQEKVI